MFSIDIKISSGNSTKVCFNIEDETKLPPFHRQYFEMHFLE